MMDNLSMLKAREISPDEPYHVPPPAQPVRSIVTLILENAPAQPEVVLRDRYRNFTWRVQMSPMGKRHVADIMLPAEPTVVYYYFELAEGWILRERHQLDHVSTPATPLRERYGERDFQITVYDSASMPPEWAQGMLIYQIFPDRFARSKEEITPPLYDVYGQATMIKDWNETPENPPRGRDFFGGDLRGIIQKLEYLHDLGVECIYLCPIFNAPSNHRYDTSDYAQIAPMLGTSEDFAELLAKAHERGMKVILDAVYNHCSCDSIYFDIAGRYSGAYHNKQSPYYRWFSFKKWPEEYQRWMGHQRYPEFVECPEVEDFFLGPKGITSYWMNYGLDGWRADATQYNSETFWRHFRTAINRQRPDAYLVCEEWENASHYLVGDMFSASMNYRFAWTLYGFFANEDLTATQFDDRLTTLRKDTPGPALLAQMNLIDSQDTRRVLTACGNDKRRLMQMVAFQMSYPGAPMVYYGDEVGITGESGEVGRKPFPWNAGEVEIFHFYRKLIATRQRLSPLRRGTFETLLIDDERRLYAFMRRLHHQSVYVCFNVSDSPVEFSIPLQSDETGYWSDALDICMNITAENNVLKVLLQPRGFAWLTPL